MTAYAARVRQLEAEGLCTSDAQAVADAECDRLAVVRDGGALVVYAVPPIGCSADATIVYKTPGRA